MKTICLFAGYNKDAKLNDSVIYYIEKLAQVADVYYMADGETDKDELEKISPYVKGMFSYRHEKYDFGSWQELIKKIGYKKLATYNNLILCNDSVFGPFFELKQIIDIMDKRNLDFWGITKNTFLGIEHIQSYFIFLKKCVFTSECFKTFFENIKKENTKSDVVSKYEIPFTKILSEAGFVCDSYIGKIRKDISPDDFFNWQDPCLYWKQTLKLKNPFLKKSLLMSFNDKTYIAPLSDLRKMIVKHTDYDPNLITQFMKENDIVFETGLNVKLRRFLLMAKKHTRLKKQKSYLNQLKYIALYLPQFHTFPENDQWWGRGFTEWTNVKPATPRFSGHYQPHVPHDDIGYYDLSDVNVMIRQAQMAKRYGIYGFSYYYYWFNGRKLMEKPLENMLHNKDVDIPFCLFWANHNWTRAWDAGDKEILLEQTYDATTNHRFIDDLIPYFRDPRYIKIGGRPLFLVYQADLIPNPRETVRQWRDYAKDKYGIDLYLVTIQQNNLDSPDKYGYDAALETAPNFIAIQSLMKPCDIPKLYNPNDHITFYSYFDNIMQYVLRPREKYKLFRCVYPMWDNCPRRKGDGSWLFYGDSPKLFKKFLAEMSMKTIREFSPDEQFVFINAWNEWAEGTHLEPDKKHGYTYLEICRKLAEKRDLSALKKHGFSRTEKVRAYIKQNGGLWAVICPVKKIRDGKKRTIKLFGMPVFKYRKR